VTTYHVLDIVAREHLHTLLAQAQAAHRARYARTRSAALPTRPLRLPRTSLRRLPHTRRALTDSAR
jgi:hypothetical protein